MKQLKADSSMKAFKDIAESISEDTLLALPDRSSPFILTTDASSVGVGAILSQIQNGEERIVAFYSSLHKPAETRYSVTDQELLAVVSAIKYFRQYLMGAHFTLRTDPVP